MFEKRKELYKKLEEDRGSKVLVYITGDRRNLETRIAHDVIDLFVDHFDAIGIVEKISLFIYTRGGEAIAAWSIANLIRQFCKKFEVVVPNKAHSGGTLISLAADKILMTKQATLGPIDPSENTPINPEIPGAQLNQRFPVSVEDINGFIELTKNELKLEKGKDTGVVLSTLADKVHPLVLGRAYRSRSQIRMLGTKLLSKHIEDSSKIGAILDFLCSDSGSHDYAIFRREARELGLNVETPTPERYQLIKEIYDDIAEELELRNPFDPRIIIGSESTKTYSVRQALIESIDGGSHYFVRDGVLTKQNVPIQNAVAQGIQDQITFNGWKHEK